MNNQFEISLTKDELLERDKLKELSEPANLQDMYDYVHRPKRSVLEVLVFRVLKK